jgi:hypothetical protein
MGYYGQSPLLESGSPVGLAALALCLLGLVVWFGVNLNAWSESDYYSVPGSRDDDGEHRCIQCGHRGIYRHGEYKTNAEHAECSKCKQPLWSGRK